MKRVWRIDATYFRIFSLSGHRPNPLSTGEQRFEQAKEASLGYLSSIDSLDHMVKAHQPKGKPMAQQMISTSAAAELWNVSRSQARDYCKRYEKVIHAKKRGRNWYVPADALPPAKLKHAKQFVQSYLKNLNNPTEQFDWSSCGANSKSAPNFLRLLKEAEIGRATRDKSRTRHQQYPHHR